MLTLKKLRESLITFKSVIARGQGHCPFLSLYISLFGLILSEPIYPRTGDAARNSPRSSVFRLDFEYQSEMSFQYHLS